MRYLARTVVQQLAIHLLGSFEVTIDDRPVTTFSYAKVRALLAYLAVEQRAHTRAALATLLWPDQPEQRARASLSQALTTLRTDWATKTPPYPCCSAIRIPFASILRGR